MPVLRIDYVCRIPKAAGGEPMEFVVARTPDEWISHLRDRGATAARLVRKAQNDPRISDRMSAGFVGGGGLWQMELPQNDGQSEFWASRWEVGDKNAPERRIWRVTYALIAKDQTKSDNRRSLLTVKEEFRTSLELIHSFSERENCGGFTKCFADALKAMDDPTADIGYHKDLALPGQLGPDAASMLKAAMSAWVFGGMGSWNDMGFDGAKQKEYEMVSERLFNVLNEAIEVAASSSANGKM